VTPPPSADDHDDVQAEMAARLPADVQCLRYCSRSFWRFPDFIDRYVSWWIRHPEPGSRFEKRIKKLRWLPDFVLIMILRQQKYDGLIWHDGNQVLTHIFYARSGGDVMPFSLAVSEAMKGRGLGKWIFLDFVLRYAPGLSGARRCRVGADGHWLPLVVSEYLANREDLLGIVIDEQNWVTYGLDTGGAPAEVTGTTPEGRLDLKRWFPPLGGDRPEPYPLEVFERPVVYSKGTWFRWLSDVDRYVLDWLKRPEPGSRFERETRRLRWLPGRLPLVVLAAAGYEGLVYVHEKRILGHVFYHLAADELRVFHFFVDPELRGRDVGWRVALSTLAHARSMGARVVRIGAGGDRRVSTLWKTIRRFEHELDVRVHLDEGWIEILGRDSSAA
jgi:GNAT superfamily N-acetyltransferase